MLNKLMKEHHQSISKIQKQIKGKFAPKVPKSKKEEAEFGSGKLKFIICKICQSVYYNKAWRHNLNQKSKICHSPSQSPHQGNGLHCKNQKLRFSACPTCRMIQDKQYEGELVLENIPEDKKKEITNLIWNVGERAFERDPMDRIIGFEDKGNVIRILTSENQLALSIGKQIKRAFRGKLDIKWSHKESTSRVKWSAPNPK